MRDKERLDKFYDELKEIHKKSFPDLWFGQFCINVFNWMKTQKQRDPFFPEESEMIKLIKEYANSNSLWYGKQLSVIDRYYPSSQICHVYGQRDGKKSENIRKWICPHCNSELDRDVTLLSISLMKD